MHLLVKYFSSYKYIKEFVSGSLYMNSLDYFWNNGFDEQRDIFEGVVCVVPVEEMNELPPQWRIMQTTDCRFRADGYSFCNVLCFEKIPFSIYQQPGLTLANADIAKSMEKFGSYIAIIHDEPALIRKIEAAVRKNNFKYLCGDIHYHSLMKNGQLSREGTQTIWKAINNSFDIDTLKQRYGSIINRDCFDKSDQYGSQREWRIALYRGIKDTSAYRLELGDLSDIVTICKYDDFYETVQHVMKNYGFNEFEGYNGNVSRKELKQLFCELGDNKSTMFMTL